MLIVFGSNGMVNDATQITRIAMMIKFRFAVDLSAAASAVPRKNVETGFCKTPGSTKNVLSLRTAFQAMRQNHQPSLAEN